MIQESYSTQVPNIDIQTFGSYTAQNKYMHSLPSDGFVSKYDPNGQFVAIGCNAGQKLLYSFDENKIVNKVVDPDQIPVTCIKWRPTTHTQTKVLGIGSAQGHFQYWHIPSMKKMFSVEEKQNSILCCDFSHSGQHFATAGRDSNIRIYDEQTKSISTKLSKGQWNYPGHSNRIFSIKFIDENTMLSGGWDSVIHVWDLRQAKSVNSFYGPHVAGDSIDIKDDKILIGCYASKNQIQIWDLKTMKQLQAITWPCQKDEVSYVYSCCYSPFDKNSIVAGACGVNQVRVFNGTSKHSTVVRFYDLKHGCYAVDASYKGKQICFCTSKGGFYLYKYNDK